MEYIVIPESAIQALPSPKYNKAARSQRAAQYSQAERIAYKKGAKRGSKQGFVKALKKVGKYKPKGR